MWAFYVFNFSPLCVLKTHDYFQHFLLCTRDLGLLQPPQTSVGRCPNLSTRLSVQPGDIINTVLLLLLASKGCYSHPSDVLFILRMYLSVSTWIWLFSVSVIRPHM